MEFKQYWRFYRCVKGQVRSCTSPGFSNEHFIRNKAGWGKSSISVYLDNAQEPRRPCGPRRKIILILKRKKNHYVVEKDISKKTNSGFQYSPFFPNSANPAPFVATVSPNGILTDVVEEVQTQLLSFCVTQIFKILST